MSNKKNCSITPLVFVIVIQLILLAHFQGFVFFQGETLRLAPLLFTLSGPLTLYLLCRYLLRPWPTAILVTALSYLINKVHQTKQSLSNTPLTWSDLTQADNLSVVSHYISFWHIVMVGAFFLIVLATQKLSSPSKPTKKSLAIALGTGLICLIPYYQYLLPSHADTINNYLSKQDIHYISWNWPENITKNGLFGHLVWTSLRHIPPHPNEDEKKRYETLNTPDASLTPSSSPQNIIFILCEACWHDDNHFNDLFTGLTQQGYTPFRAISPVYGGGTVNATFELMTGLPANGALNGVIYQEYAALFNNNIPSIAQALKASGYKTFAMHNHDGDFWQRRVINPKLGFDHFYSIENMANGGPGWARDKVLFDKALETMQRDKHAKHFMLLTTVHTHGAYWYREDFGENYYREKLSRSLQDIENFTNRVKELSPDSLILLISDHKPALSQYFYHHELIPREYFYTTGKKDTDFSFIRSAPQEILGDVPGYIYYDARNLAPILNDMPIYCLPQIINQATLRTHQPVFRFAAENNLCVTNSEYNYRDRNNLYPPWLYSLMLF